MTKQYMTHVMNVDRAYDYAERNDTIVIGGEWSHGLEIYAATKKALAAAVRYCDAPYYADHKARRTPEGVRYHHFVSMLGGGSVAGSLARSEAEAIAKAAEMNAAHLESSARYELTVYGANGEHVATFSAV